MAESISILSLTFFSYDIIAFLTIIYGLVYYIFIKKPLIKITKLDEYKNDNWLCIKK